MEKQKTKEYRGQAVGEDLSKAACRFKWESRGVERGGRRRVEKSWKNKRRVGGVRYNPSKSA